MSKLMTWTQGFDQIKKPSNMAISRTRFKELFVDSGILKDQSVCILKSTWNAPLIIYEAPGKAFGNKVSFMGFEFDIPPGLQGKANIAIQLPIYMKDGTRNIIREGPKIVRINDCDIKFTSLFPSEEGWYGIDSGTGIQKGQIISKWTDEAKSVPNQEASWLDRRNGPFIGFGGTGSDGKLCTDGRTYNLKLTPNDVADWMTENDALAMLKTLSRTLTFKVNGMTCGHCESAIQKDITSFGSDVISVIANHKTGMVEVLGTGLINPKDVERAITEAGIYSIAKE